MAPEASCEILLELPQQVPLQAGGDPCEQARQYRELARQDGRDHAALRIDDDFIEAPPVTACLAPRSIENREAAVVDKNA